MHTKPLLRPAHPIVSFITAGLAGAIAIGMLASVTTIFQRDGRPFERMVAAERACVVHAYLSEREACIRQSLAASRVLSTASK